MKVLEKDHVVREWKLDIVGCFKFKQPKDQVS